MRILLGRLRLLLIVLRQLPLASSTRLNSVLNSLVCFRLGPGWCTRLSIGRILQCCLVLR